MMAKDILSPDERELFMKLYYNLLVYVAQEVNVDVKNFNEFLRLSSERKVKIRDVLYKNIELFDKFIKLNPPNFNEEELNIIRSWKKHHVHGKFILIKNTKDGAIFFEEKNNKAYLVKAITSSFNEILPFGPPIIVETVLLPFKGKIIYDGLLSFYKIFIGRNMSRSLRAACDHAILEHGLITSLPHISKIKFTEEEKLRYYLSTKERREEHAEEIEELLHKNPELLPLYYKELGRINSRQYVKQLKKLGIKKGWFAILGETIIASGLSKEEVQKIIDKILPQDKKNAIYIFQIK
ncbi:MAG: hypothetical protein ACP5OK_07905 [Thermoprotei archaeon]